MHAAWGAAEMWPTMAPLLLVHSQRTVLTSCNLDAQTRTRADAHTRRRAHAHTRTRADAHTHAHAHAQAYAHTRTHTCTRKRADVAPARGPHARVVVTVAQLEIASPECPKPRRAPGKPARYPGNSPTHLLPPCRRNTAPSARLRAAAVGGPGPWVRARVGAWRRSHVVP